MGQSGAAAHEPKALYIIAKNVLFETLGVLNVYDNLIFFLTQCGDVFY